MDSTSDPADTPEAQFAPGQRDIYAKKRERREIEAIARELERPASEIAEIYSQLYADLKAHAQVTDYLEVLVARKVRARFRTKQSGLA